MEHQLQEDPAGPPRQNRLSLQAMPFQTHADHRQPILVNASQAGPGVKMRYVTLQDQDILQRAEGTGLIAEKEAQDQNRQQQRE